MIILPELSGYPSCVFLELRPFVRKFMLRKRLIIIFIVVSLFFAAKNLLLITNKQVQLFSGVRDVFAESADIKVWFEVNTRRVKRKEIAINSSYIWDGRGLQKQ